MKYWIIATIAIATIFTANANAEMNVIVSQKVLNDMKFWLPQRSAFKDEFTCGKSIQFNSTPIY